MLSSVADPLPLRSQDPRRPGGSRPSGQANTSHALRVGTPGHACCLHQGPGNAAPRCRGAPLAPAQPLASAVGAASLVDVQPASAPQAGISRSLPGRIKVKPNSLLAARAETEYVYVGRDLRRIAIVGAGMFGTLILLWILLVVLGLSGLYG